MFKKTLVASSIFFITFLGAGCSLNLGGSSGQGGVFKSTDTGKTWQAKSRVFISQSKKGSIGDVDVNKILIDPRDSNSIFLATKTGLYASDNGAETWTQLIGDQNIIDVSLDTSSKCVLYAVTSKKVMKTSDCARSWQAMYNESQGNAAITSIAVDWARPEILYLSTTAGNLLRSEDRAVSWTVAFRFNDKSIDKVLVDRGDSNVLFMASRGSGVYRSINQGSSWEDRTGIIKDAPDGLDYRLMSSLGYENGLLYASKHAIFITTNAGQSWEQVNLLTAPNSVEIFSAATNPANSSEIVYATATTIYHTFDSGRNWTSRPLPSNRAGAFIAIDPNNGANLYLGMFLFQEKSKYF